MFAIAADEAVLTESLFIEEHPAAEAELAITARDAFDGLEIACAIDTELPQEAGGDGAVLRGCFDVERAAIHQIHAAGVPELVTLGVAPEIVVVVEDQDLGARAELLAVEMRLRQAADTPADNDEIVTLRKLRRRDGGSTVTNIVSDFERAGMAPAHARSRGRVILALLQKAKGFDRGRGDKSACQGDPDSVQEVTSGDGTIHPELANVMTFHLLELPSAPILSEGIFRSHVHPTLPLSYGPAT